MALGELAPLLLPAAFLSLASVAANVFVIRVFHRLATAARHKMVSASINFGCLAVSDAVAAVMLTIVLVYYSSMDSFKEINSHFGPGVVAGNASLDYTLFSVTWKYKNAVVTYHPTLGFFEALSRYITLYLVLERTLVVWFYCAADCVRNSPPRAALFRLFICVGPFAVFFVAANVVGLVAPTGNAQFLGNLVMAVYFVNYILPLVLILFATGLIVVRLDRIGQRRRGPVNCGADGVSRPEEACRFFSIAEAAVCLVCHVPDVIRFVKIHYEDESDLDKATRTEALVVILYFSHTVNSFSNLIVYLVCGKRFRREAGRELRRWSGRGGGGGGGAGEEVSDRSGSGKTRKNFGSSTKIRLDLRTKRTDSNRLETDSNRLESDSNRLESNSERQEWEFERIKSNGCRLNCKQDCKSNCKPAELDR